MSISYIIQQNIDTVKQSITSIIAQNIKKDYVKTSWKSHDLYIKIEKMGSSEIVLGLEQIADNVKIFEKSRKIALMHKPFIAEVERLVNDILGTKLGAQKA